MFLLRAASSVGGRRGGSEMCALETVDRSGTSAGGAAGSGRLRWTTHPVRTGTARDVPHSTAVAPGGPDRGQGSHPPPVCERCERCAPRAESIGDAASGLCRLHRPLRVCVCGCSRGRDARRSLRCGSAHTGGACQGCGVMRSVAHDERSWGCATLAGSPRERCRGPGGFAERVAQGDVRAAVRKAVCAWPRRQVTRRTAFPPPAAAKRKEQIQRQWTHTSSSVRQTPDIVRTRSVYASRAVWVSRARRRSSTGIVFRRGRDGAGDVVGVGDHNRTLARHTRITNACVLSELEAVRLLTVADATRRRGAAWRTPGQHAARSTGASDDAAADDAATDLRGRLPRYYSHRMLREDSVGSPGSRVAILQARTRSQPCTLSLWLPPRPCDAVKNR